MAEKTGMNGIVQAAQDNRNAEMEQIAADVDYIAMMTGIDLSTEESEAHEQ